AGLLHRQLQGESVDWQTQFAEPLKRGVGTFRCYVEGWYAGTFQDVILHPGSSPEIRAMISAILAGYAWDERNPFVSEPRRLLRMLSEICASTPA
ncbi:FAD-dependent oxidoreductase, partial [Pseudomonas yamanorum]|nr:FAD-dependent oxidoreductase [Pseudomonas yamanorum]